MNTWKLIRPILLIAVMSIMIYAAETFAPANARALDSCDDCENATLLNGFWAYEMCALEIGDGDDCVVIRNQSMGNYCATHCSPCSFCAAGPLMNRGVGVPGKDGPGKDGPWKDGNEK